MEEKKLQNRSAHHHSSVYAFVGAAGFRGQEEDTWKPLPTRWLFGFINILSGMINWTGHLCCLPPRVIAVPFTPNDLIPP